MFTFIANYKKLFFLTIKNNELGWAETGWKGENINKNDEEQKKIMEEWLKKLLADWKINWNDIQEYNDLLKEICIDKEKISKDILGKMFEKWNYEINNSKDLELLNKVITYSGKEIENKIGTNENFPILCKIDNWEKKLIKVEKINEKKYKSAEEYYENFSQDKIKVIQKELW